MTLSHCGTDPVFLEQDPFQRLKNQQYYVVNVQLIRIKDRRGNSLNIKRIAPPDISVHLLEAHNVLWEGVSWLLGATRRKTTPAVM